MNLNRHEFLIGAFKAALGAADPRQILPKGLADAFHQPLKGRVLVLGAGKAAASMAQALEVYAQAHWPDAKLEDRKSTRLNSSHSQQSRMPSSA